MIRTLITFLKLCCTLKFNITGTFKDKCFYEGIGGISRDKSGSNTYIKTLISAAGSFRRCCGCLLIQHSSLRPGSVDEHPSKLNHHALHDTVEDADGYSYWDSVHVSKEPHPEVFENGNSDDH
ncbi:hypothetical protein V6N13_091915 [Hibiscus sabdariffa]